MSLYTQIASRLLFPLHERLKSHQTQSILRELEASQWQPVEQIQALQLSRLRNLLTSVSASVPYYHDFFRDKRLQADGFRSLDDLAQLPVADKTLIRAHLSEWRAADTEGLSCHSTSGSSGEPLHFLLSKRRISFDIAAKWRATRWWDVDIGDREMVLWASSLETGTQDRIRGIRDRLLRSRLVPARDLNAQRIDEILDEMCRFRPRMLFGYPSALARIAMHARARRRKMDGLGIRVAFCTSEVLRPEWRSLISRTFGCNVANEYGARDAGLIARECPHGGLHITAEELIVEIVDEAGRPLPNGIEGDILITNLAGAEFPFIRYRTGDRGIMSSHRCACGRGLPLLESVSGRANDGLIARNGSWVHGSAVNHVLREIPGLLSYQVVQDSATEVTIRLCLEQALGDEGSTRLVNHTKDLLGSDVKVSVQYVAGIPPEANGKFRHIICRVDQPIVQSAAPPILEAQS